MARPVRKPDVHDAILDAAAALYRRYGYRKTTMEDIAEEASICRATIYLHYHGKEEIALAWGERLAGERRRALEAIACLPIEPGLRLERMLVTRVMFSFDFVQDYSESIDEVFRALRPALLARRERYHEEESQILARVIREGNAGGGWSVGDVDLTSHILLLATNSLLPYSLSVRQLGRRREVETKAQALARVLVSGLSGCDGARPESRAASSATEPRARVTVRASKRDTRDDDATGARS